MPGGWSKVRDVSKLAETRAEFDIDIPVAELPGIPSDVAAAGGTVHALVSFEHDQGFSVAGIAVRGMLRAVCQRCMQPVELPVEADSRVAVVASEPGADAVPSGWDTYLAPDGRLELAALVAEEVLLALPIVACTSSARPAHRRPHRQTSRPKSARGRSRTCARCSSASRRSRQIDSGVRHGRSKKPQDALQARHASFARRARHAGAVGRSAVG